MVPFLTSCRRPDFEDCGHVLEGVGHEEAGLRHRLVLHGGRLELRVGEGTSVAELHLGLEHARASTDGPGDDWLGDDAVLDGLDHPVLLNTTDLTQKEEDLALRVGLVSEHVVDEGGSGVAITTNGNAFVDAVGGCEMMLFSSLDMPPDLET